MLIVGCAAAFMVLLVFLNRCFGRKHGPKAALWWKMICSSFFLAAGLLSFCLFVRFFEKVDTKISFYMVFLPLGLLFGWLGDLFLGISHIKSKKWFLSGVIAFLINHIFYLLLLGHSPVHFASFVFFALFLAGGILLFARCLGQNIDKPFLAVGGVYYLALSGMTSLALGALFLPEEIYLFSRILFALGALLFFFSDVFLILCRFARYKHPLLDTANAYTYFLGQLFIALSPLSLFLPVF